jgi:Transglutaminase-like superfamily
MKKTRYAFLVLQAVYELVRYDVLVSLFGSGYILRQARRPAVVQEPSNAEVEQAVCGAFHLAACLYWKPVLCLQRGVCTVRLLKRQKSEARLVIGYRPAPFFSHAWVEVDGRVVYGSAAYQKRLQLLHVA